MGYGRWQRNPEDSQAVPGIGALPTQAGTLEFRSQSKPYAPAHAIDSDHPASVFSLSSAPTAPPVLTPRLRGTRASCLHKATHPTHAVPTLFPPALAIPRKFLNSIERSKDTPSTIAPAFKHKLLNRGHRGPKNITHSRPGTLRLPHTRYVTKRSPVIQETRPQRQESLKSE